MANKKYSVRKKDESYDHDGILIERIGRQYFVDGELSALTKVAELAGEKLADIQDRLHKGFTIKEIFCKDTDVPAKTRWEATKEFKEGVLRKNASVNKLLRKRFIDFGEVFESAS